MPTVHDKVTRIIAVKAAIKDAIEAKGPTVGSIPFDEYAGKIAEIADLSAAQAAVEAVNGETSTDLNTAIALTASTKLAIETAIEAANVDVPVGTVFADYAAKIGEIAIPTGDAIISDVLIGKTFSNSVSAGLTGTRRKNVIAKTGQKTSYNAGDDGDFEIGEEYGAGRFTDNGDGTISDNFTGLMWVKNLVSPAIALGLTWPQAVDYCIALDYAGHTDWRMPNKNEMQSIIDISNFNPALPTGHPFINAQTKAYATSSTNIQYTTNFMQVLLWAGEVNSAGKAVAIQALVPVRTI